MDAAERGCLLPAHAQAVIDVTSIQSVLRMLR
jgi:hypothetical protein